MHRIGIHRVPANGGDQRAHDRAMGVHAALGLAGGARTVGDDAEIIDRGGARGGCVPGGQRGGKAGDAKGRGLGIGAGGQGAGHGQVEIRIGHVAIARADQVMQVATFQRGQDVICQFQPADCDARAGIGDKIVDFPGAVHRVHRHHGAAGAQDRVKADDVMRAVLHEQQDRIATRHPGMLQIARERANPFPERGKAEAGALVDHGGAAAVTGGGKLQVGIHRAIRDVVVPGAVGGPEIGPARPRRGDVQRIRALIPKCHGDFPTIDGMNVPRRYIFCNVKFNSAKLTGGQEDATSCQTRTRGRGGSAEIIREERR